MKRGEVYFCEYDRGVGSEVGKTRPAVIIQNDIGNEHSNITIRAMLTHSTDRKLYPMQFDIGIPTHGVSRCMCEQIRTVDKSRLREKIWELSEWDMAKLDRCLCVSLGIEFHEGKAEIKVPGSEKQRPFAPAVTLDPTAAMQEIKKETSPGAGILERIAKENMAVTLCPIPAIHAANITLITSQNHRESRNIDMADTEENYETAVEAEIERMMESIRKATEGAVK